MLSSMPVVINGTRITELLCCYLYLCFGCANDLCSLGGQPDPQSARMPAAKCLTLWFPKKTIQIVIVSIHNRWWRFRKPYPIFNETNLHLYALD